MTDLPTDLHTVEQVRALDRYAIDVLKIPGYTLMTRAAAAALRVLRARWRRASRVVVVCGSGNNAGDGYVLARLAKLQGLEVEVISLSDPGALEGDAKRAFADWAQLGCPTRSWNPTVLETAEVIVDAIFGIGLSRELSGQWSEIVAAINATHAPVLALDVPSGLHADTGKVLGAAIVADCTVTFIALKVGFYLAAAPDHVGDIEFDDLELDLTLANVSAVASRVDATWLKTALPKRSRLAHKGSNGHVLVVGGGAGMAGAAKLTAEASLRAGSGLVTVATIPENVTSIVVERPELIVRGVRSASELHDLIEKADVVAVGPGMGRSEWSTELFNAVVASRKPLVVDADALNLLAARHSHGEKIRNGRWILTPHPGEAARLLQITNNDIQSERLSAATRLVDRFGGIAVLKGAHTLIAGEGRSPVFCDAGNPSMATPGMGDVLTGVIAGVLAQSGDMWLAARAGVVAHAHAGDLAAAKLGNVDRGVLAADLFEFLPQCVGSHE